MTIQWLISVVLSHCFSEITWQFSLCHNNDHNKKIHLAEKYCRDWNLEANIKKLRSLLSLNNERS